MKILFTTAHPYLPEMVGGMQFSAHEVINRLQKRGHECAMLSGLMGAGLCGAVMRAQMKFTGKAHALDKNLSYCVFRAWHADRELANICVEFKPDKIVVLAGQPVLMANAARRAGMDITMWLQDVELNEQGGDFAGLGDVPCIANSLFTAQTYKEKFGISAKVIYPIIKQDKYKTASKRRYLTMINPHPHKGVDLALEIARRCPDLPFLFVKGWPLNKQEKAEIFPKIKALPNVRFIKSQKDMRRVYGQTKILLVPSQWDEAFGRVSAEAQVSGIPVLSTDRGGLPESVGDGGILFSDHQGAQEWVKMIMKICADEKLYNDLSEKALLHSRRTEMVPEHQVDLWEDALISEYSLRSQNLKFQA